MVNKISGIQVIKRLLKNPFIFGASVGILVVIFNISIASLAEGSIKKGFEVFLTNGIFVYLIPLAVSVQMGLFRYHRNITTENIAGSEKMGMAGSATSTLAMWPVLVLMYYRLAKREEIEALEAYGERYEEYRRQVPMFLPSIRRKNIASQVIL